MYQIAKKLMVLYKDFHHCVDSKQAVTDALGILSWLQVKYQCHH